MVDPRIRKLADVLVQYSVALAKGDVVVIKAPPIASPLVVQLYRAALEAGAHPHIRMVPNELAETLLKYGSDEQLEFVSPLSMHEADSIDATIGIWGEVNTKALTNTDSQKHAKLSAAHRPIEDRLMERESKGEYCWTGSLFPTNASAQDAGMSLGEYEDFVFGAGFLGQPDPVAVWKQIEQKQQQVVDLLNGRKTLHLEAANGTDLTMSVERRKWINCGGKQNFPDGEVFTCPIKDSVNGTVAFSFPAVHMGNECEGVKLRFENGRAIEATAEKGEDFLNKMIDQDEGARFVGEFAFGCNYNIQQFTRNTLFDEKIGGTVHLALGMAFPEAGGQNKSGLHWDMVCDLRPGGRITVDGDVVHEDGKFTTVKL
ncbi:MAG: aminopeptidase [Planctomycetota bacterium]|jgi:aminopeptidase